MGNKYKYLGILVILGFFMSMNANARGMYYNIAYNTARALAQSAWDNLKDGSDGCATRIDQFRKIVDKNVKVAIRSIGTDYKGPAAEDFGLGYINGLRDGLDGPIGDCNSECEMLGDALGGWAAQLFCDVGDAIGHAPTFTTRIANIDGGICGRAYRKGCHGNFARTAKNMCPAYTRNKSAFRDYYRGNKGGACGYDPS